MDDCRGCRRIDTGEARGLTVRLARVADIDAMHGVRMGVRENILANPLRVTRADYERLLGADGCGWVYEIEGEIVGFGIADRSTRSIWALFVLPEFEGIGIGRALHDVMLEWLFGVGQEPLWLTTEPGTRAEQFYQAAGWRRVAELPGGEVRLEFVRD